MAAGLRIVVGPKFALGRQPDPNYPAAATWFDELIVSTQPIADPFQGGTGVQNRISFPNPGRHAEGWIHDLQGRKIKAFSGVSDRAGWFPF